MKPDAGGGAPSPRNPPGPADESGRPSSETDESTGLPGLRSWRGVYSVVLGLFVLWVALLTWLTFAYS
jgi:hypothetical protein